MGRTGAVIRLDEEPLIEPAMALMSCGPAFMALVAESFAEAGAAHGLDPDDAMRMVVETMGGTADYLAAHDYDGPGAAHAGRHAGRHHRARPDRAAGARARRRDARRGRRGRGGHPVSLYLAITRNDVADYINTLTLVYLVLIFIRILMSWIPRMPYNRYLSAFLKFVTDVTDPYLNLFRRVLPPVRMGGAGLDLSPIVATIVLILVSSIVVGIIDQP